MITFKIIGALIVLTCYIISQYFEHRDGEKIECSDIWAGVCTIGFCILLFMVKPQ